MSIVKIILNLWILGTSFALAEVGAPNQAPNPPPPNILNPNSIQIFDKDFFAPKKEEVSAPKPGERARAEESEYPIDRRRESLSKCGPLKEKDGEAYRKCYQEDVNKYRQGLKDSMEAVERRQNEPLRNTNPLLEEQQRGMQSEDFGD